MKKSASEYYLQCQSYIEKICSIFSVYFKLDKDDLLSLSNESFMKSYNNYHYFKVSFIKFMSNNLINDIKTYYKQQKRKEIKQIKYKNLIKNEILIQNESNFNQKFKINDKNNVINDIFELVIQPNFRELLRPFMKNTKYKSSNFKYAIQEYIYHKHNHSYYKIQKAFGSIRQMLKTGEVTI